MKTLLKHTFFLSALLVLVVSTAHANIDPATAQKLLVGDGVADDLFGYSVSVFGDTAIIGVPYDDNYKGSAYAFTRAADGSWSQQQKLQAGDGAIDDNFGNSVSVSGDTAVIGALGADSWAGAVYAFTRSGGIWSQQQKLTAKEGTATDADMFGRSVALSLDGNIALVGSGFYADEQGAAYIFTRSGGIWSQQQRLTASDGMAMDGFGCSVSLSSDGGTALVGTYGDDSEQGAAYIFTRSGGIWSQQQKLTAADGAAGDRFGLSVAVFGNTVIVGAYLDDDKGEDSGSAYIFTQEQVSQERINMVPIYMLLLK